MSIKRENSQQTSRPVDQQTSMIEITLHRSLPDGKAVRGQMSIPFEEPIIVSTLENADFLIPAGTYPLERTWSPKFKKLLPLILEVPEREGIRIHRGTTPEHSTGCILTDLYGMSTLDALFNRIEKNASLYETEPEKICLTVLDPA